MAIFTQTLYGGLAQLGERIAGSDEVAGSIPVSSTNFYQYAEYVLNPAKG